MATVKVIYVGPLQEGEVNPKSGPGFQFQRDVPVEVSPEVAAELMESPVWREATSSGAAPAGEGE